jgi:hypothetical protein
MTPRRDAEPDIMSPAQLVGEIRGTTGGRDLRKRYKGKPLDLAEKFNIRLPRKPEQVMKERGLYDEAESGPIEPGIRDLVEDICSGEVTDAVVVGPRGGGKSMGVAFIEFYLWEIELYDALNLGGSEIQADAVYRYLTGFLETSDYWMQTLKGEPMVSYTETVEGAWVRVLTASTKSVRSPHAGGIKKDGRKAGGILVIDEEAEAAPEIVEPAMGMVDTALPSVSVRSSTFHNLEGSFADLVDNHVEMGYKMYRWDIFDVCQRCECVSECESEEPCFREDHVEDYMDPDTGVMEKKLVHKAYCGGKARFADGWIPVEEIHKMWRRWKRSHARFEVEAMGSRPTTSGHVIKDLTKYAQCQVNTQPETLYVPGSPITICVDWGTVAAAITVWQELMFDHHLLLHADSLEESGQEQIFGTILGYVNMYQNEFKAIRADIGGGGNYLNKTLRETYRLNCEDVAFAEVKESGAAAFNMYSEAGKLILPSHFTDFHGQVRKWRRKNGRIQKGNDHFCDSAVCYFSQFIERLGVSHIRVPPRSFSSSHGPGRTSDVVSGSPARGMAIAVAKTVRRR